MAHMRNWSGTYEFHGSLGGGTRYGELATWLEEHSLALHNMGSLPHISVAGAISTGTHGSGLGNGCLSTAVRSLSFAGPNGDLRSESFGSADFPGSVVSPGRGDCRTGGKAHAMSAEAIAPLYPRLDAAGVPLG